VKVLVFGTFDHFHPGHQFVLNQAQKRGELFVVIARDSNVKKLKNLSATWPEEKRMAAVQEAFPSAQVMMGDKEDFLAPVKAVQPDLILLGYDQKLPPGVTEADFPCPVERLPAFEPEKYKSSIIRKSLQEE
jgi:FAD synthetase